MDKVVKSSKKAVAGIVGGVIVLIGLILVPYPGPGWLIVFAGLAVLSTEFHFARRLLKFARSKYDIWAKWLKVQPWLVQILAVLLTTCVVAVTLWALNTFGMLAGFFDINYPWLTPPYFR